MSFFQKSSRTGEPFIPAPTQEVPGIQPIVVQAVENLFPGPDDRKRVFDYLTRLGKWSRTYRQPKWRLAFLYYSKGKIENLIEVDSPLLRDPRFIGDEIEPIFPSLQDAEEWVRLITNWRSDGLSHGMLRNDSSWVLPDALKSINRHFGFMLERGYEIDSARDDPDSEKPVWEVILQKQDLFVRIYAERGVVESLSFRMDPQPPDEFADIRAAVYAVTRGRTAPNYFGGTKGHADLLRKYIDQIERHFGEYARNAGSLQAAEKGYFEAISPKFEEVAPKEEKIIPILYYPLMGIMILLLFGALTTLYMVLLERLFTAFSLDAGGSGIFLLAPVFAIGSMLVLRSWRRKG